MNEFFYDFRFDETNHGYYYLKINNDSLYSLTRFIQPDGNLYTNRFRIKLLNGQVVEYQYQDQPWVNFNQFPQNAFPSSAYQLLLNKGVQFPYSYPLVDESKDQIVGIATIKKEENTLHEILDGKTTRKFMLKNNKVHKIDWGGPTSSLWANAEEAILGSPLQFEK